jgi:DnaJ family protein A protein 2
MRICEKCEGKGGANSKTCTGCNGQRQKQQVINLGGGMFTHAMAPCETCQAQGVIFEEADRCKNCEGKRIIKNVKKFDVPIDQGVPHEHDYIMSGEADEYPGALAGDLYFRIMIDDHPDFGRKGADLYHLKKISLLQALTGMCFSLNLLDGTPITIASAKRTNHRKL